MKPKLFESGEMPTRESIASNKVQIVLMPEAFEDAHPGAHVDMEDPEDKRRVVAEWLTQYAALYRNFTDAHTGETIDLDNHEAVHELWLRIKAETKH